MLGDRRGVLGPVAPQECDRRLFAQVSENQKFPWAGPRRPLVRAAARGQNRSPRRMLDCAICSTVCCHFPPQGSKKGGAMSETSGHPLSVAGLFAERDARGRHDQEALEQLQRRKEEELAEFRKRLDNFQLTDAIIQSGLDRIKRAFERGETELMFSSFPSDFCTDGGRAIINAGAPPINKPTKEELAARPDEPEWLETLPTGVRQVYDYWKNNLKPGGFGFSVRIINYPGGVPGDVGLFFTWPRNALEA
jgi:hypothetical protein